MKAIRVSPEYGSSVETFDGSFVELSTLVKGVLCLRRASADVAVAYNAKLDILKLGDCRKFVYGEAVIPLVQDLFLVGYEESDSWEHFDLRDIPEYLINQVIRRLE